MKIQKITVDELCSTYAPLYPEGGNWDETIKYMLNSKADRDIILELMKVIYSGGSFREHVTVGSSADEQLVVLDGTHRVVASILLKVSFIEICFYDPDIEENLVVPEKQVVEVRLQFIPSVLELAPQDDFSMFVFDHFRSIKVTEKVWLNSDVSTGSGTKINFYYAVDILDDVFLTIFSDTLISLLEKLNLLKFLDKIIIQQEEVDDDYAG